MPLYDFSCPKCNTTFEDIVRPDELPPCPACGNADTQRRVSAPSPQKTGAFPYKVGPVHPMAKRMPGAGGCGMGGGCGGGGGGGFS